MIQMAACVYCPPFSRTPGTYPLMYPGSISEVSKGGSSNWIKPFSLLIRNEFTALMADRDRSVSPAPDNTDQLCEMASILHSILFFEPSGEPSSKKARKYHSPSQACALMF